LGDFGEFLRFFLGFLQDFFGGILRFLEIFGRFLMDFDDFWEFDRFVGDF
jgi:hypothetical protein